MGVNTRLVGGTLALAVSFVGAWEGKKLVAYRDVVGVPTICYGQTYGVKMGDTATNAECDARLVFDLKRHEAEVLRCLKAPKSIPKKSYVAFLSLAYNVGSTTFCKSTAARRLNVGDLKGACEAATWYNRAKGSIWQGLINRRGAEYKLCMEGLES